MNRSTTGILSVTGVDTSGPRVDSLYHDGYGGRMVYSGPDYHSDHTYKPRTPQNDHAIGVGALGGETSHDLRYLWRRLPTFNPYLVPNDMYSQSVAWFDNDLNPPVYGIRLGPFRSEAEDKCERVQNLGWFAPPMKLSADVFLYKQKINELRN